MSQYTAAAIRRPPTDDRPLWDLQFGNWGYTALLVAHDLKLFPLLAEKPRTLAEVCEALNIVHRPAETLLTLCVSAGLVHVQDGRYALTALAEVIKQALARVPTKTVLTWCQEKLGKPVQATRRAVFALPRKAEQKQDQLKLAA
jgi:hypothetical protein